LRFGEFVLTDFVHRDKNDRIFEARSLEDGRRVALKVLTSQSQADPLIVHRLKRDLEVSRQVGSPWAVRCEGIETYQGRSCLIREWVDGMTLRRFIETHGRFDRNQVVPFMLELARGLRAIHAAGYRHGAIRSDRIMVRPDGTPVWFDFGQATEISVTDQSAKGSAAYRELEQASHAPAGDIRTDAYFLGCIFYELLTGNSPHPELEQGQGLQTLMVRTFGSEIPLADISNPPKPEISRTVARMMAFRPEIRLSSADDIILCFERIEKGLEPETRAEPVDPSAVIDTAELYAWLNGEEPKETSEASRQADEPQVTGNRPIALEHQVDRNVLCVEAQEEIQRELRKTFDKLGWKSRMVRTTETAADMARDKPADIIVFDADGQGRVSLEAFLVAPGEAIFIDLDGQLHTRQCAEHPTLHPCMFEYVYLARPDSVLDGISVYQARLNLGETLAQRVISTMPPSAIDVVIPIPESSRPSAMQLAQKIGKPYREGFVKNRYVGRTFIMPGQAVRKKSVRQKLNAIGVEFKGRNVLLVDDSIVRGTTSKEIVQMAREAGAKKVYMASAAPPVRFPNVYGIDMPTREELIGADRSVEQIREYIGADALIYQDVDAMKRVVRALNPKVAGFEASCFDGQYITGDISAEEFETMRSQRRQQGDEEDSPEHSRLALQSAAEGA